jgi:hypothetical protein
MKENTVDGEWDTHVTREMFTRFWWESPKEGDHLEDRGIDGIRRNLREIG